jgi:hypothetical protein
MRQHGGLLLFLDANEDPLFPHMKLVHGLSKDFGFQLALKVFGDLIQMFVHIDWCRPGIILSFGVSVNGGSCSCLTRMPHCSGHCSGSLLRHHGRCPSHHHLSPPTNVPFPNLGRDGMLCVS